MKILIVKLSSIGDVIHTLPALAQLRRHFPTAEISWVVERNSAQLLRGNRLIDQLVEIDTMAWRRGWWALKTRREVASVIRQLRGRGYDAGFDFQGLLKSGLVLFLSGARRRIGFETACMREKPSLLFLTQQVPVSDQVHVIEKNLRLVMALGIRTTGTYEFPIEIAVEDREFVRQKLDSMAVGDFAIVNPGGNWKGKQWAPERYAAICDYLSEAYGLASLVTHAPGQEELVRDVMEGAGSSIRPFPCTLKQLALLADRASLFLGGDTGPMHLAAARRTPIVAIFGPTPPQRNGPFSAEDIVVRDVEAEASPYYRRRFHDDRYMNVSVEQVKEAIERRLTGATRSRSGQQARGAKGLVG